MFKNLIASLITALGFFYLFGQIVKLHTLIDDSRRFIKTNRAIGWEPEFDCSPRTQHLLERFVLRTK